VANMNKKRVEKYTKQLNILMEDWYVFIVDLSVFNRRFSSYRPTILNCIGNNTDPFITLICSYGSPPREK
jgi:hypothetical protein